MSLARLSLKICSVSVLAFRPDLFLSSLKYLSKNDDSSFWSTVELEGLFYGEVAVSDPLIKFD